MLRGVSEEAGGYSARREENVWDKDVPGGGLGKVTCYPEERGL